MPCEELDSIKIPQPPEGNYVFRYILHSSGGFGGCDTYYPVDSAAFAFTVSNPDGINDGLPSSDLFTISFGAGNNSIRREIRDFREISYLKISNLPGQCIFQTVLRNEITDFNVVLPSGIYLFTLTDQEKRQTKKMIIPHNR
ncbi:MAG: T9SS type A sorting domain-containing protein [Bacteroidales bacterium]|nr:T9SS type A sorting domain-containing protein [Bacteroidales bacterium]MBK9359264.1 T9SS type A sorting domain-containing protein [Bacteroidales bacterium]